MQSTPMFRASEILQMAIQIERCTVGHNCPAYINDNHARVSL